MELEGKRILVVGLGRSGVAVIRFLCQQKAQVTATDTKSATELRLALAKIHDLPVEFRLGKEHLLSYEGFDYIIPSPGVPTQWGPLHDALKNGQKVLGEIELAFRFLAVPIVAITGSNGKSTTTVLLGEMLKACGKDVFVGGNLGRPLIEYLLSERREELIVAEISSFQLETIEDFRPFIGMLLNISQNHLDRYPSFRAYVEAKVRLFSKQKPDDHLILNYDDRIVCDVGGTTKAQKHYFSVCQALTRGVYFQQNRFIFLDEFGIKEEYPTVNLKLRGRHNLENVAAAILAAKLCNCSAEGIQKAMESFKGLPHRLEFVRKVDGVSYFNDSKATSAIAAARSVAGFEQRIVLIAGGKDKGDSYEPLRQAVRGKVKQAILLGEAAGRLESILGDVVPTLRVQTLEDAVQTARIKADPGDVVLLAPACSSYDMFANFEQRGEQFRKLVNTLE